MASGALHGTTPWVAGAVYNMRHLLEPAELWVIIGLRTEERLPAWPGHTIRCGERLAEVLEVDPFVAGIYLEGSQYSDRTEGSPRAFGPVQSALRIRMPSPAGWCHWPRP